MYHRDERDSRRLESARRTHIMRAVMETIYLDNNATTRIDDRVVDAMLPLLREQYGNASSIHKLGQFAAHKIEEARASTAALIGARPHEIVFTAGGTGRTIR